jgi:heptosyltransferase-3
VLRGGPFRNVLLVQLGDIGDVVLTAPAIRAVKAACPGARVSILVRKPYGSLLEADPNLHAVVEASKARGTLAEKARTHLRELRALRAARYDLAVVLRTGDRGAFLSFLSGARVRVGCHGAEKPFWHDRLFTDVVRDLRPGPPSVHPGGDQSLRVVRAAGLDPGDDGAPRLHVSPEALARAKALLSELGLPPGAPFVTLNPFSRWRYKEWSDAKWGEVVDRLRAERGMPSVLVGSPEEAARGEGIVAAREGRAFNAAGRTTLGELAAVVSLGAAHAGVDSAAPHVAAAVGRPTVTLFGPGDWRAWTVQDDRHRVVVAGMPCQPCNRKGCEDSGRCPCLDAVDAGTVFRALERVLDADAAPRGAGIR